MKILLLLLISLSLFAQKPLTGTQIWNKAKVEINSISTNDLKNLLDKDKNVVLIDVRTKFEIANGGGTIGVFQNRHLERGWIEFKIDEIVKNKDTPIVVYCGTNQRSVLVAKTMMDMGYKNVRNYADGFFAWKNAGLPVQLTDNNVGSILFNPVKKVTKNIWTSIGEPGPSTQENSGHNNNLSFVVGDKTVMVFNAGGSYLLAYALHQEIKKITNKPVKFVVLENAQGHAILGASYWQEQGAKVIVHIDALKQIKKNKDNYLERVKRVLKDKSMNTKVVLPNKTFTDKLIIDLGGIKVELLHLGPAHSFGDIQAWIPSQNTMISGDIAFNERMLPVFEYTDTKKWLETWQKLEKINPKIIVPGHGDVTDLKTVTKFTKDYLLFLRTKVLELLDNDGSLQDAIKLDQSKFKNFKTFKELSRQNASRVFKQLEFE
jgi:rhodanese-related sulfurtransferase/glyoxylase-like metal-dependent hydrolase (beta-lactamase superfamily II)